MNDIVVDASVAVKWVVDEDLSDQAAAVLATCGLHAPDHWLAETVNAIWGNVVRGIIAAELAESKASTLLRVPVRVTKLPELIQQALSISLALRITVYDSLYLALAASHRIPFITNERRLIGKVRKERPASIDIVWLGDF